MSNRCNGCAMAVAIVRCRECGNAAFCYQCDERVHSRFENHMRQTISFKESLAGAMQRSRVVRTEAAFDVNPAEDSEMHERISRKRRELDELRQKESEMGRDYQEKLLAAKKKYEKQIEMLEQRLLNAQDEMNAEQANGKPGADDIEAELEHIEADLKAEIAEAEVECKAIEDKSSKLDSLIDRVSKATQIENEQLKKMNEVIGIFKACSDQLQKEKELLMLDNEKLIGEVEIFAKFFDENGPLLQQIQQAQQQQQQVIEEEEDNEEQNEGLQ